MLKNLKGQEGMTIFTITQKWHSGGQRFDPAYLHQYSCGITGFGD